MLNSQTFYLDHLQSIRRIFNLHLYLTPLEALHLVNADKPTADLCNFLYVVGSR